MVIRDARPDDLARIRELTRSAYSEYRTVMTPSAWDGLRDVIDRTLAGDNGAQRIVCEIGGRIVGSVMLSPPAVETYGGAIEGLPWPEVRLLAVDPSERGREIARSLMAECITRVRRANGARIGLHTSRSMVAAVRMYERMGFQRAPEFDFQPPGAELVEAYTLDLTSTG